MNKPTTFVLDVDGVMTDGQFYYSEEGKVYKVFGADDHDALCLLKPHLHIHFVTGDKKGFPISSKRIAGHMEMPLDLVSTTQRLAWMKEKFGDLKQVIYMGDGIFDPYVFHGVGYGIACANALDIVKKQASFVTPRAGGDRAVAEACLHILEKFFTPYNPEKPLDSGIAYSGQWQA
jgi:3-deoxy-D-manno-octulosonate 8-phosphate phosphatase (KDO 8-P phosphatase)